MRFNPHTYQTRAIKHILDNRYCALFLSMGLGKTVSTLTAVDELLASLEVDKVLVIAPKSVALNTWTDESSKWDHLNHLRISVVMGTARQRLSALESEADIYVVNRENVVWLVGQCGEEWPFDCVVIDESSSFKSHTAKRFKALLKVRPYIRRMVELTGTPCPNGLMDLWAQMRLLDQGARLGKFITQYRSQYFHAGAHNGAVVYQYLPNRGAKETISNRIADICLTMKAGDYLDMPMVIDGGMTLRMEGLSGYKKFEKDCVLDLPSGEEIAAVTAVSLTNKLLQYASGAVYDEEHVWHKVDDTKIEAFVELLEQTDEPVLVYYNYQHEWERISEEIPFIVKFKGEPDLLKRWNDGDIKVMAAHPASVAYGLNMQKGGHIIVWYSPTWNLELYEQANARLNRQGQTKPVVLYHLICKGTMDEVVMEAIKGKRSVQDLLLERIKRLQNEKTCLG